MSAAQTVTTLVVGPPEHGVVRHAVRLASLVGSPIRSYESAAECTPVTTASFGGAVHVHYTDRLFGPDATGAAATFERTVEHFGGRLIVSLHDVPFLDETPHSHRRADAYRAVSGLADIAVVASHAEASRMHALRPTCCVRVLRMPVGPSPVRTSPVSHSPGRAPAVGSPRPRRRAVTVGVIGFVYPGKGHAEVIDAASRLPMPVRIVAAGTASEGHDELVRDLQQQASSQGIDFELTGFVTDQRLTAVARAATVPIVASTNTSASASMITWLEAGRRPLVAATDYTTEFDRLSPGAITLYDSSDPIALRRAICRAIAEPSSTWRDADLAPELACDVVVDALLDIYGATS